MQRTVLKADTENKLLAFLQKIVKESKKKGLTINCKNTTYGCQQKEQLKMWIMSWRYQNQASKKIWISQSVLTEDGKCDTKDVLE